MPALANVSPARAGAAVNWTELSVNELLPTETVRLLMSAPTVQHDLTPVFTKLGLSSRVELVQEVVRHT